MSPLVPCVILSNTFFNFLQVRDILKGTLRFSQGIDDEEINITENHYRDEVDTSPESDTSGARTHDKATRNRSKARVFYMSSEDNSEVAESPEFSVPHRKLGPEVELEDYDTGSSNVNVIRKQYVEDSDLNRNVKPLVCSENPLTTSRIDELENSPNPLYCRESWD